jgi:hypothetical protein
MNKRLLFVIVISGFAMMQALQAQASDISGDWQVSWQGRLGTEECVLHLRKEDAKLTGTFEDLRGSFPLTGTVDGKHITFEVHFSGPRPFTTRFTGNLAAGKLEGASQAIGIGGSGAYLGHGGEVVQPEHPWTAKRAAEAASQSRN